MSDFTERVRSLLAAIPRGHFATYGQIAAMAGQPRAARQVVWVMNSSRDQDLPWFRVLNRQGRIALPRGQGFELQRQLLESEGIPVDDEGQVGGEAGPAAYIWRPSTASDQPR